MEDIGLGNLGQGEDSGPLAAARLGCRNCTFLPRDRLHCLVQQGGGHPQGSGQGSGLQQGGGQGSGLQQGSGYPGEGICVWGIRKH